MFVSGHGSVVRDVFTPAPVQDLDPGFAGVTTFYERINIHLHFTLRADC